MEPLITDTNQETCRILVLDDDPARHEWFKGLYPRARVTHARTAAEAIWKISDEVFDLLHLDHDLEMSVEGAEQTEAGLWLPDPEFYNEDTDTGFAVVQAMIETPVEKYPGERRPRVIIHSYSAGGAARMLRALRHAKFDVRLEPYLWQEDRGFAKFLIRKVAALVNRPIRNPWSD